MSARRLIVIKAFLATVTRKIICTDYNGNNRETYDTAAEVMGLKVVNDIAYYVTLGPQRYCTDQLLVCILLEYTRASSGVMYTQNIRVGFGTYLLVMVQLVIDLLMRIEHNIRSWVVQTYRISGTSK